MSLIDRAKQIVLKPKDEWAVIGSEEPNVNGIFMGYVFPLALIPAVASFIGYNWIGASVPFSGFVIRGMNWGIYHALVSFIGSVVGVFVGAFIIDALAPTFASQKNFGRAFQLVSYSYTPVWLAGVFQLFPILSWLGILGLYAFYLLFLGFSHTMQTPREKILPYLIVSLIVMLIVYLVVGLILSSIFLPMFGFSRLI